MKISIRIGDLSQEFIEKLAFNCETPSQYIRRLIAEDCKIKNVAEFVRKPAFRTRRKKRSK